MQDFKIHPVPISYCLRINRHDERGNRPSYGLSPTEIMIVPAIMMIIAAAVSRELTVEQ